MACSIVARPTLPLAGKYIFGDLGLPEAGGGRLFYLDNAEVKELTVGNE